MLTVHSNTLFWLSTYYCQLYLLCYCIVRVRYLWAESFINRSVPPSRLQQAPKPSKNNASCLNMILDQYHCWGQFCDLLFQYFLNIYQFSSVYFQNIFSRINHIGICFNVSYPQYSARFVLSKHSVWKWKINNTYLYTNMYSSVILLLLIHWTMCTPETLDV